MPGNSKAAKRVFIAYAEEQRALGEETAALLRGRGYIVHAYTAEASKGAKAFDAQIQTDINNCDLFVFFISPDSVKSTSYCQNELEIVKRRWSSGKGRVLPVMVEPTSLADIDGYLKAIDFHHPKGKPATSITLAVNAILVGGEAAGDEERWETPAEIAQEEVRAFIQRAEVRLSTMHRVSGAFVSGAGLVVLLPFLLGNSITTIIELVVSSLSQATDALHLAAMAWVVPVIIAILLPLYSIYLLLRDLVIFFFIPHGEEQELTFLPRYAIAAISYPAAAGDPTKEAILRATYSSRIFRFGIMADPRSIEFYDILSKEPGIKPSGRARFEEAGPSEAGDSIREKQWYNVASGVAGLADRTLVDEAARLEASLVRHNIALRAVIIRYAKALLLTLWTAISVLLAFAIAEPLAALSTSPHDSSAQLVNLSLAVAFAFWALVAQWLVKRPVRWLAELSKAPAFGTKRRNPSSRNDAQFWHFEDLVVRSCWAAIIAATISSVAAILVI